MSDLPTIGPGPRDEADPALRTELHGFQRSDEIAAIGDSLIGQHNALAHLEPYEILYLLHHDLPPDKAHDVVKVGIVSGWQKALASVDAAVIVNAPLWGMLDAKQQQAVVMHGLLHLGVNDKTGALVNLPHDVEEFSLVAATYGAWRPGLRTFGEQLSLALADGT